MGGGYGGGFRGARWVEDPALGSGFRGGMGMGGGGFRGGMGGFGGGHGGGGGGHR